MPISKYNKAFGGKAGSAAKAKEAMREEYGSEKGERVFYASKNKGKIKGVDRGRRPPVRRSVMRSS